MLNKKRGVFLQNISLKNLENLYHIETNVKSKIRLQCAILRKEGKTLEEISALLHGCGQIMSNFEVFSV